MKLRWSDQLSQCNVQCKYVLNDKIVSEVNYNKKILTEKLAEATRKYASLKSELSEMQDVEDYLRKGKSIKNNILRKKNVPARKMQEMKLAFSEFYLSLILLQNYQNLNFTGFRKILKKHDKVSDLVEYIDKSNILFDSIRNGIFL